MMHFRHGLQAIYVAMKEKHALKEIPDISIGLVLSEERRQHLEPDTNQRVRLVLLPFNVSRILHTFKNKNIQLSNQR